jgi:hypothetical protein
MIRSFSIAGFLAVACFCFSSCRHIDYFEKNTPIADLRWKHTEPVTGHFRIQDTATLYNVFLILRHTDSYHFNNIWVELTIGRPADTLRTFSLDLPLGSDADGWEGTGMNDIWEVRKKLTSIPIRFKSPGEYDYSIAHIMREDPLGGIMSAGLRVEKAP